MIYAVVVWTQLPETVPPMSKSKQTVEASSKAIYFKHYAIFGLMVSTLPISFFAQTETNYRIFAEHVFPNLVFILHLFQHAKPFWKSYYKSSS